MSTYASKELLVWRCRSPKNACRASGCPSAADAEELAAIAAAPSAATVATNNGFVIFDCILLSRSQHGGMQPLEHPIDGQWSDRVRGRELDGAARYANPTPRDTLQQ